VFRKCRGVVDPHVTFGLSTTWKVVLAEVLSRRPRHERLDLGIVWSSTGGIDRDRPRR
jgi:hypothetical protein